jgi:hypothetical protein
MNFRYGFALFTAEFAYNGKPCVTKQEAENQLKIAINHTCYLNETNLLTDYDHYGWIEELRDGEWEEIYDDEDDYANL